MLSGRARFEVDGETLDAPAGTIVFLPEPTSRRHAVAEEDGTTVLALGGEPGEPTRSPPGSGASAPSRTSTRRSGRRASR